MVRRVALVVAPALLIAAVAWYALRPERGVPHGAPSQDEMARSIGADVMEHVRRGHVAGRSGEIYLVPKPHNFLLGDWDLTTLGTDHPTMSTSHPNPWDYLTRVPIVVWGPGYVGAVGSREERPVDIADIAPTIAEILGMDLGPYEGEPLIGAPDTEPPRVIFNIVIDGGGWNALEYHSRTWPNIKRLMDEGLTFINATIGSAPSITGALHSTMGTGVYPIEHGIPGNQMRGADGENTDTWRQDADPRYLESPTVSELWDEQNDNEPVVATVSYEGWHLGMIGHGAQRDGGDHDIAVLWEAEDNSWWVNEDFYELPEYLQETDLATLEGYEEELDPRDGIEDGTWFGHTLGELQEDTVRPGTPAFVRFTGDAIEQVIREERIGGDPVTDIMWIEMKMPDYAGHAWNMTRPEQGDVIAETDAQIGRFLEVLDDVAGLGNYMVTLTADHGQQPLPDEYGGWRINNKELQRDVEARFGNVIEKVTPVDIYVDREALEREGTTMDDIARFIGTYTLGENLNDDLPGHDRVPEARLSELLFAGAFSTDHLQRLTIEGVAGLGAGDYPEGRLYIEPGG